MKPFSSESRIARIVRFVIWSLILLLHFAVLGPLSWNSALVLVLSATVSLLSSLRILLTAGSMIVVYVVLSTISVNFPSIGVWLVLSVPEVTSWAILISILISIRTGDLISVHSHCMDRMSRRFSPVLLAKEALPLLILVCTFALAFRDTSPRYLMVCIAILSIQHLCCRTCFEMRGSLRQKAINVVLILVSISLSLAVAEVGMRCFYVSKEHPNGGGITQYDPEYIFTLAPNGSSDITVAANEEGTFINPIKTSEQGFRDKVYDPKKEGEYRILMLGDSFTMGHAVPEAATIPKLLEAELGAVNPGREVSVINAGMGGAGPIQELGILRKLGLPHNPDMVILQVYPENDIEDSLQAMKKHLKACNLEWQRQLADFLLWDKKPYKVEAWMERHFTTYRCMKETFQRPLIAELLEETRFFPRTMQNRPQAPSGRPFWIESNLKEWYPELHEGVNLIVKYVKEMEVECRNRGIPFFAYCIPTAYEINADYWDITTRLSKDPSAYERYRAISAVEDALTTAGIQLLQIRGDFHERKVDELYFVRDGHTNAEGNRVIAHRLARFLCEECWPKISGGCVPSCGQIVKH